MCPKIIIEGVTEKGVKFRPSDWAERLSGNLFSMRNNRITYSPLLKPTISKQGNKCVVLDHSLKNSNPLLYEHILDFAKSNNLKICEDDEILNST